MRKRIYSVTADLFFYILGSFIYSAAVTVFISANKISPGGVTGIATLLNYLFRIPTGFAVLILNIPIIIIGLIKLGGIFILKTSVAIVIVSIALDVSEAVLPSMRFDRIIAAIFGGILMGAGLGLILLRGATTGGVDILAKIISRRFPQFTVGRLILFLDSVVILLAAAVYRNIETAMYSVVAMYMSSYLMDMILYGADKGRIIYVVTSRPQSISAAITGTLGRGVTHISVRGGYTGADKVMLMCAVRTNEVGEIYAIIRENDPAAFTVTAEAGEIIGEGFKTIDK